LLFLNLPKEDLKGKKTEGFFGITFQSEIKGKSSILKKFTFERSAAIKAQSVFSVLRFFGQHLHLLELFIYFISCFFPFPPFFFFFFLFRPYFASLRLFEHKNLCLINTVYLKETEGTNSHLVTERTKCPNSLADLVLEASTKGQPIEIGLLTLLAFQLSSAMIYLHSSPFPESQPKVPRAFNLNWKTKNVFYVCSCPPSPLSLIHPLETYDKPYLLLD